MSVAAPAPAAEAEEPSAEIVRKPVRAWRAHLLMAAVALAMALYVTHGLWQSPYRAAVADNPADQAFFEWVLSYGVHLLKHGGDPFFATVINAPNGVNLAANTSVTVYAILFAPLTKLAGPQISFMTVLTLNLACSAFAWYLFLGRWFTRSRAAAALGGLFCGFAPGFISHANGHLNWTSGWIAPLVLWWMLRLRQPRWWLVNGFVLGLLFALGFTIAAEGLFFIALAGSVFVIAWSAAPAVRSEVKAAASTVLAGLAVSAVVAGALLAYPLYMHFAGPQTFAGTGFDQKMYSEDLGAYFSFADRSLAAATGMTGVFGNHAANPTEQTTYFGLPLMIVFVVSFVILWRRADAGHRATLRALAIVGGVFVLLSFGPRLKTFGKLSPIPMPYALLKHAPLFDSALPSRYGLIMVGVIGIVLARVADELLGERPFARPGLLAAAITVSLVPLIPLPLLVLQRAPEPKFIADGTWKQFTKPGGTISTLPFAINVVPDGQRWQAYTMARGGDEFTIPDGYFLGPDKGGAKGPGRIGAFPRRTDWLFLRAASYGYLADITDYDRALVRRDFAYWNVTAVFMPDAGGEITGPDGPMYRSAVEITATDLLGPPEHVDDVLVWRIRPGVDPMDSRTPGSPTAAKK